MQRPANVQPVRTPSRRLLVSIHDVGPRSAREVEVLRAHLARYVPLDRVAMLVVPDHWGEAPLVPGSRFARRLSGWAADGAEVFAHGWYHRDTSPHRGHAARFKARHMTAGEGEFLGLGANESERRMRAGQLLIESVIGRPVAGFVAPAWLYGEGARTALSRTGFAIAEDHWRVWRPCSGETLCRGPVITWASRSRARIFSSLAVARLLPVLLARAPVVRLAVHPGDTGIPALMDSIARTLEELSRTRAAARYGDLLPDEAAA